MTPCCGLLGRIFGHRFQEFEVRREETPPGGRDVAGLETSPSAAIAFVSKMTKRVVERQVCCRRCGARPEESK